MRNICLTLEYDGSSYAGWQVQDNAVTVQGVVEQALSTLLKGAVRITASGRTDSGVHALGQVANFRTGQAIPLRGIVKGLNARLPRDVTVRRAAEVPSDFDSRRSAREKTYQYFIHRAVTPSAFARRTTWHVTQGLDLGAMREAAATLVGTHDFSGFRSAGCDAPHAVRTVHELWVRDRDEFLELGVRGNAFLRNMVRIIVGTLVEVGTGKRGVESVREILDHGDRSRAGATAPAQGLFLSEVRYDVNPLETYP